METWTGKAPPEILLLLRGLVIEYPFFRLKKTQSAGLIDALHAIGIVAAGGVGVFATLLDCLAPSARRMDRSGFRDPTGIVRYLSLGIIAAGGAGVPCVDVRLQLERQHIRLPDCAKIAVNSYLETKAAAETAEIAENYPGRGTAMKQIIVTIGVGFLSLLLGLSFQVGSSEDPDMTHLQGIPIQDYDPVPMLEIEETSVNRARFGAVDVHNHLRRAETGADVDEMVRAMDAANVAAVVNLDGGLGEALAENIERMNKKYPDRFIQFMRLDWARIDEPGFGQAMAEELEAGFEMGARGLKISKRLGLNVRDKSGELVPIDDPRLDPVWAKCGELGIPVAIHIADPAAFFTPLDEKNERLVELMDHPNWSFYGPDFPEREELHAQRNRIIEKHPETNFIGLHVANNAEDLKMVSEWLDRYPNLYVETGARLSELGRQPYTSRRFFLHYQDRVLFGTDTTPLPGVKLAEDGVEMYRLHWRFFESDDEYFDVSKTHHRQALWRVYGIYLPPDVLEKLYRGNALRLIPDLKVSE